MKCNEQRGLKPQCDKECKRILQEKEEVWGKNQSYTECACIFPQERQRLKLEAIAAEERAKKEAEEALLKQLQGRSKKKRRPVKEQEKVEKWWWSYKNRAIAGVMLAIFVSVCYWWIINMSVTSRH